MFGNIIRTLTFMFLSFRQFYFSLDFLALFCWILETIYIPALGLGHCIFSSRLLSATQVSQSPIDTAYV